MYGQQEQTHHAPGSNRDYDFFYQGLEDKKILVQECGDCKALRTPPEPMCPHCNSLNWSPREMAGTGTLYSFVVHRHPPLPGFDMPHPIGLVTLTEGVRMVAGLDGTPVETLEIGLPVKAEFIRRGNVASVCFRPA